MSKAHTLNLAQAKQFLSLITGAADTLENFAAYAAERAQKESHYDMHMIQAMAQHIGALAECATSPCALVALVGFDFADMKEAAHV